MHKSIHLWNKITQKLVMLPPLNPKLNIVIPGSCKNSDLSTPIIVVKKKLKNYLLERQNSGSLETWSTVNL